MEKDTKKVTNPKTFYECRQELKVCSYMNRECYLVCQCTGECFKEKMYGP